jgi:hypothetical protein
MEEGEEGALQMLKREGEDKVAKTIPQFTIQCALLQRHVSRSYFVEHVRPPPASLPITGLMPCAVAGGPFDGRAVPRRGGGEGRGRPVWLPPMRQLYRRIALALRTYHPDADATRYADPLPPSMHAGAALSHFGEGEACVRRERTHAVLLGRVPHQRQARGGPSPRRGRRSLTPQATH